MKNLLLSLMLSLCCSTGIRAETTIRITNGEWEPFLSEYCYEYGLASHIISEAYRLEGIDVEWGFFKWKRSYANAKVGKAWDASAVWWPTEETKQDFLVTVPVVGTSFVFFHADNYKFDWNTIDDLKGIPIGITRSYTYGKEFETAMKDGALDTHLVTSDEQNYRKLLSGRIKIFPNDPIVGYAQIRTIFPPNVVKRFSHHPKKFEVSTLNLIISKKIKDGPMFIEKFNSGMKKLKENGTLDKMYKDLDQGKYDKQKTKWKKQS